MSANQNPNLESREVQEQEEEGEIDIRYKKGRDKPCDVRNVILTVAVLLAAATYQAALNPPGGIWQEEDTGRLASRAPSPAATETTTGRLASGAPSPATTETTTEIKQVPGKSILATKNRLQFILFMTGNTIGFIFSMNIIDDLINGFTRQLELRIAGWAICFTYGLCLSIITPSENQTWLPLSICLIALAIVVVVRIRREKWSEKCTR